MGTIISNGIIYGGGDSEHVFLTQEEYDALPDTKLTDGKLYFIDDGSEEAQGYAEAAANIYYQNAFGGQTTCRGRLTS